MLIDTHAHIYLNTFDDDFEDVLDRARSAGVENIIMPAIDVRSIEQAIELCERHDGLFAMAAIHPSEVKEASDSDFARVEEMCGNPHVVAIGESGLDYYWDRTFDEKQHDFLRAHIRLAVDRNLPIVFHNREATSDLLRIVAEEHDRTAPSERLRGIFHCFTGSTEEAGHIWELGFYVGIGGMITFKNAGVADAVQHIPLECVVLETDAPYLAPTPYRGKRNEPAHLKLIAEELAEIKDAEPDYVAAVTSANAARVFQLPEVRS